MIDTPPRKTFAGCLVRLDVTNRILPERLAEHGEVAVAASKDAVIHKFATFLTEHFLTEHKNGDGSLDHRVTLVVMLDPKSVPAGLAHTKIIFQEQP